MPATPKSVESRRFGATPLIKLDKFTPDTVQKFMSERVGPGKNAISGQLADYLSNPKVVTTTLDNGNDANPTLGSYRWAVAGNDKKYVTAIPELSGIIKPPNRSNSQIKPGSNTLSNMENFRGSFDVGINPIGTQNSASLCLTIRNLFEYSSTNLTMGSDHMGYNMSNAWNMYLRWVTIMGTGDACFTAGSYAQNRPFEPPFGGTVQDFRIIPMTEYPLMAPIPVSKMGPDRGPFALNTAYTKFDRVTGPDGFTWYAQGAIPAGAMTEWDRRWFFREGVDNAIDNWWTNAKGGNSAWGHNDLKDLWIPDPTPTNPDRKREPREGDDVQGGTQWWTNYKTARDAMYSRKCYILYYNGEFVSTTVRGPKFKGQSGDCVGVAAIQYGHSHLVTADGQSGMGAGMNCEDEAQMALRGCVWVPMENGAQWLPMPAARAAQLGVPVTTVKRDAVNFHPAAISKEGSETGTCYIDPNNWLPHGVSVAAAKAATGATNPIIQAGLDYSDWNRPYDLPAAPDVSTEAKALQHLEWLRTHAGNQNSTTPVPDWRSVHPLKDDQGNIKLVA